MVVVNSLVVGRVVECHENLSQWSAGTRRSTAFAIYLHEVCVLFLLRILVFEVFIVILKGLVLVEVRPT
jgi:hypothetical protein